MITTQNEIQTISAKTYTPTYDRLEDRFRLAINYSDFESRVDLWITRSFLLKFFPIIEDYILKYEAPPKPTVNVKEHKEQLVSSVQKTQNKTDQSSLKLYEKEPLLVISADITYKNNNFELVFKTKTLHTKSTLSAISMKSILDTIFKAVPKIEWGISPNLFTL